ncbi:MAG: response regulator transcription factor [Ardenticatenaceae bacterium]|nr:response regulator transcription factor [Ardenticatenaceae bacterium]
MTTVLVIDNCSVFRFGIRALLETDDGLDIITESDHSRLLEGQNQQAMIVPDVLVLSSCPPELVLPELVAQYHQCFPETQILVLLNHENETDVLKLVENGVLSCMMKSEPTVKLVQALEAAVQGERYFSPPLLAKLMPSRTLLVSQPAPSLTKQEIETLRLVAQGKTNKEMAQILQISERTVCNYLQRIRSKLNTQTTTGAVFRATQLGILST